MTDMLNTLEQADTQLLLFLNGFHNSYWDYFMMMYSSRFVWIPFYASFLYVMFRNYDWRSATKCLVAIIAIVVLCDQTTSGLIKPMVERLRPSNTDNPISPMVHIVNNYRGGRYGFPSSHAANAWGNGFLRHVFGPQQEVESFPPGLGHSDGILTRLYGEYTTQATYWWASFSEPCTPPCAIICWPISTHRVLSNGKPSADNCINRGFQSLWAHSLSW